MSADPAPQPPAMPDSPKEPTEDAAGASRLVIFERVQAPAPDVIARFDRRLRLSHVYHAAEPIVGAAAPLALGATARELGMPDDLASEWEADLEAVLATGEPRSAAFACYSPSGQRRLETHLLPELGADGAVEGVLAVSSDIGARASAEEARRRASVVTLASGVAHAFNNLSAIILGNAELALADLPAESPLRGGIEQIAATSQRAAELTRQLLLYAGKAPLDARPLGLNDLVHASAALLGAALASAARPWFVLAPALPDVLGDELQLRQALLNLVTNAVEALAPAGGRITITTALRRMSAADLARCRVSVSEPPGDYVALAVADTGCGMDRGTLERIFEPFFSTKFIGRGLGLAVVQGIVGRHHGALDVASAPGHGSTFTILLPAMPPER